MGSSVFLAIFWHAVGAGSAACFYAPLKQVRNWSWETMWCVAGFFSWFLLPWTISYMLLPDFWAYYSSFSLSTLAPIFLFGAMWGIGNVNYGLTMRFLGMSMGIGIAIGITLSVGTLFTPILNGTFVETMTQPGSGWTILGIIVALVGVGVVSYAGYLKEKVLGIKVEEFNLRKGLFVAVLCGIFSAGMSFAMAKAVPMQQHAAELGINPLYVALPSYVVIMGGGGLVNLLYCFVRLATRSELSLKADLSQIRSLLVSNVLFAALGGIMWYLQFFFYAWGHAYLPKEFGYMSWMLHMSCYVMLGALVGLILKEWTNVGRSPVRVLVMGCFTIILAANIVGLGMKAASDAEVTAITTSAE